MSYFKIFISGLLLLLITSFGYSQTADFTFTTSNNLFCSPQSVTFTQNCTGNPDGFIWRFGNGQIGSLPTQTVTYTTPGTYTVTLTALYSFTAVSVTRTVVINPTPTIAVAPDRNYICQPGNITFTATGSAFISTYEWDFGDGSPPQVTGSNSVTHFFNSYNNFTVTVRGVSAAGCFANASTSVRVERFPIINASVTPGRGCIPINSTLTASATLPTGDATANFVWDFGDGSPTATTAANNTTHTYNIVTPITSANVTITTVQGCTNQFTFPPFAFGTPPFNTNAVTTSGRDTFCASENIQFSGTATNANSYSWDFGDGDTVVTPSTTINHRYRVLGNRQVILTPLFNGCAGITDTIDIVIEGVIANYTFTNQCSARNTFVYNNVSVGNVSSFRWTFSDIPGTPDVTNYNTTHTFPANGSFTTKLFLFDAVTGCSDSLITNQFTATPVFTSSIPRVCKDSTISYTVLNPYPPLSGYQYEFHVNGSVVAADTIPFISFVPTLHGVFNDFVIINGPGNNTCDDTLYLPTPVAVQGPVLNFSVPTGSCFLNNRFPITNNTLPFFPADSIVKWQWSFGDNTTDSIRNPPPHTYTSTRVFQIMLTATDRNGCAQKDSVDVSVYPMPILNVIPGTDTICAGQSLNLFAFTVDTLLWRTNYNLTCTNIICDTVSVNPLMTTAYIAQAINEFGCISTDTSFIRVYEPINLQVLPADTSVCPRQIVRYRMNATGITTWTPSTYLSSTTIGNPVSIPDTTITYTIIVADSVGCFADTATAIIRTFPLPTVNAGLDLIIPSASPFTLAPVYSAGIAGYQWSPPVNSLSCLQCPVTTGIAEQSTVYRINVTSINGCKAEDSLVLTVACRSANFRFPSAFTPNNDGLNDIFYPLTKGYKIINKLVVYNRWGNKVFERYNFTPNTPSLGWKGDSKNKLTIDSGVFVWLAEGTCDFGEKVEAKGTVVLIR
ncbi:MAG: PKD domain-containing protein [Bacteroidota bacterium]|nr:PKD domain-containing protein [Bacteroidota bacterium]